MRSTDDLKTDARIRDEAIVLFGRQGIAATTIRDVAEAPGFLLGSSFTTLAVRMGLERATTRSSKTLNAWSIRRRATRVRVAGGPRQMGCPYGLPVGDADGRGRRRRPRLREAVVT